MTARATPVPIPGRVWLIAAVTGAGAFMAMLDATLANLALEPIRSDLGTTLPVAQWIVTGYLVALTVSLPANGWLCDRFGHGRVWGMALAAFTFASAWCALAPGIHGLIAARCVQGLAAGLMIPAGQAVIGTVADKGQLGRVFGTLGVVVSLGPALGPGIGGLLLEIASWRWLFWLNVPVGIGALVIALRVVPGGGARRERPLDGKGLALLGIGLPLLVFGATAMGTDGISPSSSLAACAGTASILAFAATGARAPHPLVDPSLLREPGFAIPTLATGVAGANMFAGLLLLPLFLQFAHGMGLARTGAMLLAMGLGSAVALYVGGRLTDRFGATPVMQAGAWLLIATTLPFLLPSMSSPLAVTALLVLRGAGLALVQMPATAAAYAVVERPKMGDAATLVNIVQRMGGALGAAGMVVVIAQSTSGGNVYAEPGDKGWEFAWAFLSLLVLAIAALACALFLRRHEEA